MPLSAGQQFRARVRKALLAGASFEARGEANKRLLEEVRVEVEKGKEMVNARTTEQGDRVVDAISQAERRPTAVLEGN